MTMIIVETSVEQMSVVQAFVATIAIAANGVNVAHGVTAGVVAGVRQAR
ncbi:hypothetical protein [Protofrankia symbiont of Coriaria ruscifolia]|uniref:Putative membrane protein n=1 Tax=Candidatus Protofrankia californiensis TaxID=1839754 RepID=A0A1C3NZX6_9ACTN|nr:hypothetical protein [Protofrankia symbiont of Coriaria ruscifolia]SBW23127.1 putative membrane protein [Candidatus Protofrankia californiensis]